ncbi:MAG: prefoldin subunit alpha [Thermoplasmata archaeon]|nr:prefoldin subunit alpha [Thermoplasmata archaeon]
MSAPRPTTEQEVQEDLVRLDAYRNQLNALLQQHQYLTASHADHRRARETLEGIEKTDATTAFLLPVGGETFLHGSADASAKVLIGIGSGVVVEMERPKASELLAQRLTTIEKARQDLEGQMGTLEERIDALSERLESLSRSQSGRAGDVGRD